LLIPAISWGTLRPRRARASVRQKCDIIPLLSCERDISGDKKAVGISYVGSEVELILARASIFTPLWAMALNICNPPPTSSPVEEQWNSSGERWKNSGMNSSGVKLKTDRNYRKGSYGKYPDIGRVTFVFWLFSSTLVKDFSKIRRSSNESPFSNKLFTASQFPRRKGKNAMETASQREL